MYSWQKTSIVWLCTAFLLALPCPLPAHEDDQATAVTPVRTRVLGNISFPTTSEVPEAQQAFIQGMMLLHLFEYPYAREEFLRAQELDPGLAMAYWGEAMTFNHPIWDEQDLPAARAALQKLGATPEERVARTPVAREQGFLAALEQLYGPGTKAQRDQAYMRSMEQLAAAYPEDHEVQLFYALSLFGVQAGVRDTATYMLATAIAEEVFCENPQHPGAAHYLIHGVDDPLHAVLGLHAARALGQMAPDAAHAQHMTSHIFVAVGMWDDVVAANEAAVRVANAMRAEHGISPRNWGHYNYWLLYGYLQQGQNQLALELLRAAYAEVQADGKAPVDPLILDPDRSLVGSVVQMWARYVIETRGWDGDVAGWSFNTGEAYDPNLTLSFIKAMQAAHASQVAQAGQYHSQFRSLQAALESEVARQADKAPGDLLYLERLRVMDQELLAAIEMARGQMAKAAEYAREASRMEGAMPFSFGPPFVDLPSAEFLGDLLLASRQYQDAAAAFQLQLERTRLKPLSLEGLAQSLEKLGRDDEARYQRAKLERIRHEAAPESTEPSF